MEGGNLLPQRKRLPRRSTIPLSKRWELGEFRTFPTEESNPPKHPKYQIGKPADCTC